MIVAFVVAKVTSVIAGLVIWAAGPDRLLEEGGGGGWMGPDLNDTGYAVADIIGLVAGLLVLGFTWWAISDAWPKHDRASEGSPIPPRGDPAAHGFDRSPPTDECD